MNIARAVRGHSPRCLTLVAGLLAIGAAGMLDGAVPADAGRQSTPRTETTPIAVRPPAEKPEVESFSVDTVHSMTLFRVRHLNAGAFWGRFNTVKGSILHAPGKHGELQLDITIDIASVDTGSESLDTHLKAADFFHAEEFPEARFKSTSARLVDDRMYEVKGELTMRGVTKPITTRIEWLGTADGRMGRRCGFETTLTVNRSDFGVNYGIDTGVLGDETRLVIALEGIAGRGRPDRGRAARGRARDNAGPDPNATEPPAERRGPGLVGFITRFDANKDGKLQKDELPPVMQGRFDDMDANGDGDVVEEELRAMMERVRSGDGSPAP